MLFHAKTMRSHLPQSYGLPESPYVGADRLLERPAARRNLTDPQSRRWRRPTQPRV